MRHRDWPNLTDTQRTYWLLKQAGSEGLHSWELAEQVPTRNASQRVKDCVTKGQPCFSVSEPRNGRHGARYFLGAANAPDYAVKVEPNNGPSVGCSGPNTNGGGEPAGSSVKEPCPLSLEDVVLAIGKREFTLAEFEAAV